MQLQCAGAEYEQDPRAWHAKMEPYILNRELIAHGLAPLSLDVGAAPSNAGRLSTPSSACAPVQPSKRVRVKRSQKTYDTCAAIE